MSRKLSVPPREDLEEAYGRLGSISALAREYQTSNPTIRKWLKGYGIELKGHLETCRFVNSKKMNSPPSKITLEETYARNTLPEMQQIFGVGQTTIYKWLEDYEIPLRTLSQSCKRGKARQYADIQFDRETVLAAYKEAKNSNIAADVLGISYSHFGSLCKRYGIERNLSFRSQGEAELASLLGPDVKVNSRSIINPYEIDLYLHSKRLAIEYCGLYWHSEVSGGRDSKYHRNKWKMCRDRGIDLLTVFDIDDEDKIVSLINKKMGRTNRVYARETVLREVEKSEARNFHRSHHIHGVVGSSVDLGLYHNDELVMVVSFSKPRFNKEFDYECSRMTSRSDTTVVGGASKLFKHFMNDKMKLVTYSDLRFGHGDVYGFCGMEHRGYTPPNYWYFHTKDYKLYSRVNFQKHTLKDKLKLFYPDMTEFENMKMNGWDRIWDCGSSIWST